MNLPRPTAVLALAASLVLAACGAQETRGDAEVDVRVEVAPAPPRLGPVMFTVAVTDLAWRPLNGAGVTVTATPPSEGREAHEYAASGIGAGKYQIPNFPLDEVGDWVFTVRVELTGGQWAEVDASMPVGESEDG